ncbi:MAG: Gfo/Idh/MocA family oxidoreductase [Selenomonadaceae bacterium]|nr:Gfo/Idh/MocA family oxidoreductase [Selenomonadaceae bacterium]
MINWGIIGIGYIDGRFAESLRHEPRSAEKASALAKKFATVYIALPHAMHKDFAIRALKAGKAVLCEKPATLDLAEIGEVTDVNKVSAKVTDGIDYHADADLNFSGKSGKLECAFDRKKSRHAVIRGTRGQN